MIVNIFDPVTVRADVRFWRLLFSFFPFLCVAFFFCHLLFFFSLLRLSVSSLARFRHPDTD